MRLISRNRTIFNDDYPQLIDSLKLLTAKSVVIDAEIAVVNFGPALFTVELREIAVPEIGENDALSARGPGGQAEEVRLVVRLDETENRLPELTECLPEDSTLIGDNCQGR